MAFLAIAESAIGEPDRDIRFPLAAPRSVVSVESRPLLALTSITHAALPDPTGVTSEPRDEAMTRYAHGRPPATTDATDDVITPSRKRFGAQVAYDRAKELISVKADQAALDMVLREISRAVALPIVSLKDRITDQVSVDVTGESVEQVLKRLLEGFNSTFVYAATNSSKQALSPRLTRVIIVSKKEATTPETRSLSPASIPGPQSNDGRDDFLNDEAAMLRALLEGGPRAKEMVGALKQSPRDQDRERIIGELLGRLTDGTPPEAGLLAALKEMAPERATQALVDDLRAADVRTRIVAAAALGRLGAEGAIEPLVSLVAEDDAAVRQAAATSLALTGGSNATGALLRAYAAGSNAIRYAIAVAIASHGDAGSQSALASLAVPGMAPLPPTAQEAGLINPNQR